MEVNMFQKRFLFVGILFFAITLFSLPKVIKLASGEYAPFTSEKIAGYGFAAEIVTTTLIEMGHEPEYKFYPWKRSKVMTEKGNFVSTFPWALTEERKKTFLFSDMFCDGSVKLFYYKDKMKDFKFNGLNDLKKYKIGGTASYSYVEELKAAGIKIDEASTDEAGFRKLMAGRLDFFPCSELVGRQLIAKFFPEEAANFNVIDKKVQALDMGMMISKKHPDGEAFLKMFNEGLKKIKANGTYDKILRKYGIK